MKKILSLIIAIMMIATFALTVSAEEVKAGNTTGAISVNNGVIDGSSDGVLGSVILGESDNWEVSMTLTNTIDNPEYSLLICGKDNDGDGNVIEGPDSFLQVFFHGSFGIRWHGCDKGWGNVDGYGWTDEHFVSTGKDGHISLNVKVKLSGKNLEFFVDDKKVGDTIVVEDKLMFGNVVAIEVKHPGNTISNVVFTDHNAKVDDTPVDDKPVDDKPVAPKTGEATSIVALVSVLALAGVVIASKKRA